MNRFWEWKTNLVRDQADASGDDAPVEERELFLNGAIADNDTWFENDVTPQIFKDELQGGAGNITVWINSPGGDCFAAAQIYNMLREYHGRVTVKIDSLAASAASVIAMAGDEVLISPTGLVMVHNPATIAMGDHIELEKAIDMLAEVKESIINAYQQRTSLSRNKLSKLMEDETWMDANKAIELGFADAMIGRSGAKDTVPAGRLFASRPFELAVTNRLIDFADRNRPADDVSKQAPEPVDGVSETHDKELCSADEYYERLREIKAAF